MFPLKLQFTESKSKSYTILYIPTLPNTTQSEYNNFPFDIKLISCHTQDCVFCSLCLCVGQGDDGSSVNDCKPHFIPTGHCDLCELGYGGEHCDSCSEAEEFGGYYFWSFTSTLTFSGKDCTQFTGTCPSIPQVGFNVRY